MEKAIYLLDRGFPSIALIQELETSKKKYVIRVSKSFLKVVNEFRISEKTDSVIPIHYDRKRAHDAKRKNKIELPCDFSVRCVKIHLSSGETEILITNLSAKEASVTELGEFYHLRWEIEVSYNHLKNAVQVETFTGILENSIKQEYYASLIIYNITVLIAGEAQAKNEVKKNKDDITIK